MQTKLFSSALDTQIGRTQKYKDLCRKHYYRADNYKTKHLANEFEMRDRVHQYDAAMDRVNVQANRNEELRYEKSQMARTFKDKIAKVQKAVNRMWQDVLCVTPDDAAIVEAMLSSTGEKAAEDMNSNRGRRRYDDSQNGHMEDEKQRLHNSLGYISKQNAAARLNHTQT